MADNSTEAAVAEDAPRGRTAFLIATFVYAVVVVILGVREYCMGRGPTNGRRTFPFHRRDLQPSLIKFIPAFTYSATAGAPDLECSICLSEFEDSDEGRVLPGCRHYFHTECIDMWLWSHSNCPLCRVEVNPTPARNPSDMAIEMSELSGAPMPVEPPQNEGGGKQRAEIQEVGCP